MTSQCCAALRLCIPSTQRMPEDSIDSWYAAILQAKPLEKATFSYDFRETSSSSHAQVVKKVKKSDVSATFDHQGDALFHPLIADLDTPPWSPSCTLDVSGEDRCCCSGPKKKC